MNTKGKKTNMICYSGGTMTRIRHSLASENVEWIMLYKNIIKPWDCAILSRVTLEKSWFGKALITKGLNSKLLNL